MMYKRNSNELQSCVNDRLESHRPLSYDRILLGYSVEPMSAAIARYARGELHRLTGQIGCMLIHHIGITIFDSRGLKG